LLLTAKTGISDVATCDYPGEPGEPGEAHGRQLTRDL
jgi:hypothetical protein